MPPFDSTAIANITSSNPRDPLLWLITISHPELPGGVLRLVRNTQPVVSRGNTYLPTRAELRMPGSREDRVPRASLRLDDVDKTALTALRAVHDPPPEITIELVLASTPNVVQSSLRQTVMRTIAYDSVSIEGELHPPEVLLVAYPPRLVTEHTMPAAFAAVER